MSINRRDFLTLLSLSTLFPATAKAVDVHFETGRILNTEPYPKNNVRLLHYANLHSQFHPIDLSHVGFDLKTKNKRLKYPNYVSGSDLMYYFGQNNRELVKFLFDPEFMSRFRDVFGQVGGYNHLSSLIYEKRNQAGFSNSLVIDGGNAWHGSYESRSSSARDIIDLQGLMDVDLMVGSWDYNYQHQDIKLMLQNDLPTEEFKLLSNNINFKGTTQGVFQPYEIIDRGGFLISVMGNTFPWLDHRGFEHKKYWDSKVDFKQFQSQVDYLRSVSDLVVVSSTAGWEFDVALAKNIRHIDVIFSGENNYAFPTPIIENNGFNKTLLIASGSQGKFLSVLDLEMREAGIRRFKYNLVPVLSRLEGSNPYMENAIKKMQKKVSSKGLNEELVMSNRHLSRGGHFVSTLDMALSSVLYDQLDVEVVIFPRLNWGRDIVANTTITRGDLHSWFDIEEQNVFVLTLRWIELKNLLERSVEGSMNKNPFERCYEKFLHAPNCTYTIDLTQPEGSKIQNLLINGSNDKTKSYKVGGWGLPGQSDSTLPTVIDVLEKGLKEIPILKLKKFNIPDVVWND